LASIDADLREIAAAWAFLPAAAKSAVLTVVRSFNQTAMIAQK
jgi:hypothetical protein